MTPEEYQRFVSARAKKSPIVRDTALAFVIGGLVVWQHRGNAKRLLTGTERKFSFHRKTEGST